MNDPVSNQSKIAIITGASQGLGKECVRIFQNRGFVVFMLSRNAEALHSLKNETEHCIPVACDLTETTKIHKACQEIQTQILGLGTIDRICLINNAGIFHSQSFVETSELVWHQQFQTNLFGPVELTRALLPLLQKAKSASIVNIASTLGVKPTSMTSAYSASKAAMINWTLSLAQEFGPQGIRVNCICPGIIDTPIHSFHGLPEKEKNVVAEQIQNLQLLKQLGKPEQIAEAAYFLSSQQSVFTTGSVLHIDGGINIK